MCRTNPRAKGVDSQRQPEKLLVVKSLEWLDVSVMRLDVPMMFLEAFLA